MRQNSTIRIVVMAAVVGMSAAALLAQRPTPAQLAASFSGRWVMNMELSPQFRPPAARQGAAGLSGVPRQGLRSPVSSLAALPQRGGRGGGGGGGAAAANTDPEELAGQQAIRGMQAVAQTIEIAATADSVTFTDPRGVRSYVVNDKSSTIQVDGAPIRTKSKWDRSTLKQEFIFGETRVSHEWALNEAGNRIEFMMRVDNFSGGVGRQAKAVYDKQ
jgi:hypothetical protein